MSKDSQSSLGDNIKLGQQLSLSIRQVIKNGIYWLGVFLLPLYGMLDHCRVTPNNFGYPFMHLGGKRHCGTKMPCPWTYCYDPGLTMQGSNPFIMIPFLKTAYIYSGQVRLEILVPRCAVNLLAIKTFCLSGLWDDLIVIVDYFHKPSILLRKASINSKHYILLTSWKLISIQSLGILFKIALHTTYFKHKSLLTINQYQYHSLVWYSSS